MAGEPKERIGAWTVDTLHEHLRMMISEVDRRHATELASQERAVKAALAAAEKAVEKAENATKERFESVNEFRRQLREQAEAFFPRQEGQQQIKALADRVGILEKFVSEQTGASAQSGLGRSSNQWAIGLVVAIILGSVALIIAFVKK